MRRLTWKSILQVALATLVFAGLGGCTNTEPLRKSAHHYFQQGNSSFLHRDFQSAIWNYQKAINLDGDTPEFHFNLGLAYYEIGNYPESLEAYLQAAEIRPDISDTYYNIALAYHKMEKSKQAEIYYNRYQNMLSLRKARERARDKAKQARARNTSSGRGINPAVSKTLPLANPERKKPGKRNMKMNKPAVKFAKPGRNDQNKIPNWE